MNKTKNKYHPPSRIMGSLAIILLNSLLLFHSVYSSHAISQPSDHGKQNREIVVISKDSTKHFKDSMSPVGYDGSISATQPFPEWLADFTYLKEWPGIDPPYVPLSFIDMNQIPNSVPIHEMGACPGDRTGCSFDCHKCVAQDDIYTCPKLSQSFDDGPSPVTTRLLDNLQHPTTFFTLGINVVKYPEIYKQIQAKGHLIGSHTWGHKFLPSLTNEQIIAEIEWSIWAMNATGNHIPKWFRPPYGGIDNRVRHILRLFGLQAVLWDYDTYDWQLLNNQRTEQQIFDEARSWLASSGGQKRGMILEHDAHDRTIDVALELSNNIIGHDQLTAAQCVNGVEYIKTFGVDNEEYAAAAAVNVNENFIYVS
ncbi:chitin deacetylase [Saccharomycopsis crataegensis]|uniref:chitin deacetylase n=1 Tax=Saccharomycopsis crataegensis TaxID=43959 RepID=A0AAV5QL97_9ASCO|nr:chitin deacetylase [Saccharomycopsis crataegensis]